MKQNHGVIEAFDAVDNLDIIVTSVASADDEHGLYNQFLKKYADKSKQLQNAGWGSSVATFFKARAYS
ncbi:hypothetical protein PN36_10650 [Candidatus Thiomargarita nelsonii]|uniref:Uncharacterized protein n=1 Tax=Candidatus Thiomargarita nelsonii TaxID=1003181 RepID=A0A4E0RT46_9GAMM|nr:hypothetical protein PN36_10650 [Candidatus Thiomargarita nelsonii]